VVKRVVFLVSEWAVPFRVSHLLSVVWMVHCVDYFLVRYVCLCLYLLCVEALRLAVVLGEFAVVISFVAAEVGPVAVGMIVEMLPAVVVLSVVLRLAVVASASLVV